MVKAIAKSSTTAKPTRPRLQSINQEFTDLTEQVSQAAQILGLPQDWENIEEEEARSKIIQTLVRARAEWVLRWVLDKLKDEAENGREARRNASAWKLLDWMIHILPAAHSAPHLRDAGFTSILERTLFESFENDSNQNTSDGDVTMTDAPEVNETEQKNAIPSRKRKRGNTESPLQRTSTIGDTLGLFHTVKCVVASIVGLANAGEGQGELMRMVLRTESSQAARICRFWLQGVHQMLRAGNEKLQSSTDSAEVLDLSLAFEIWDLRTIDSKDESGVSTDDFSTECLIPALLLLQALVAWRNDASHVPTVTLDQSIDILDKLLSRHLIVPSRTAYFSTDVAADTTSGELPAKAVALLRGLEPLRAKYLQAAQIQDLEEDLPMDYEALFHALPRILELVIRVSPAKTPKSRLAERSWFQATFAALSECLGCSLENPSTDKIHENAIAAIEASLSVLHAQNIDIGSGILKSLFTSYSGIEQAERRVNWPLIASLIELDGSVFVSEPKKSADASSQPQSSLTDLVFKHISAAGLQCSSSRDEDESSSSEQMDGAFVLSRIIVPLMAAFVQNRNLLGFIRRWDEQLMHTFAYKQRKALEKRPNPIWLDRGISKALADVFEQTLTQSQVSALVEEHTERITELEEVVNYAVTNKTDPRMAKAYKKAASSEVILPALLQSIQSDESIDALKSQFLKLLKVYHILVRSGSIKQHTRSSLSWFTLCQLVAKLWPSELHSSSSLQQNLLPDLIQLAANDMSTTQQEQKEHGLDSNTCAAAMMFLLNICALLETIPGTEDVMQKQVRQLLKGFSADSFLASSDYNKVIEVFCANFVPLIAHQKDDSIQKSMLTLLERLSKLDHDEGDLFSDALSRSVVEHGNMALKTGFYQAILEALSKDNDDGLQKIAARTLLRVQPAAVPRDIRELILDRVTEEALSHSRSHASSLGIMVHVMSIPNASAQICTNGKIVVKLAQKLQDKSTTESILDLYRRLAQLIFGHVIPNKDQAQSKKFLAELSKKIGSIVKSGKDCSVGELCLLRAAVLTQKENELIDVDNYVKMLKACLIAEDSTATIKVAVLDAIKELPVDDSTDSKTSKIIKAWLLDWINESSDFGTYMSSSGPSSSEIAERMVRTHAILAKFHLYPGANWLVSLTLRIYQDELDHTTQRSVREALISSLSTLSTKDKLELVPILMDSKTQNESATLYRLLADLINTLEDKLAEDAETKAKQLALLPRLCDLLTQSPDYASSNILLNAINHILNEKSSLASQCSIETVLGVLNKLTSRNGPALPSQHASSIYSRLCETARLLLLVHRGRLGGRFHLFLPLLRNLLFCLFIPNGGRSGSLPPWLRSAAGSDVVRLTASNATHFTRLVTTLCSPPQSSITKAHHYQSSRKSNALNDPVRAAREKTSHFLYPLLASFCRFQLNGRLDAKVREKLMPGVWEVVGTASLHREALDAMFAGLTRSEKDVWRGVWSEWEEVHGRKARVSAIGVEI